MKAIQPTQTRRLRPSGALTAGGRITLLLLVTGVLLLAQAWQVAHRYGRRTASLPPVPARPLNATPESPTYPSPTHPLSKP